MVVMPSSDTSSAAAAPAHRPAITPCLARDGESAEAATADSDLACGDPAGAAEPAGACPSDRELPRCDDRRAAAMPTTIAAPITSGTDTSRTANYTPVTQALLVCRGPSRGRTK